MHRSIVRSSTMVRQTLLVVAAAAFIACTPPRYAYGPVMTTSGELTSSAAFEAIPRGDVRITMLGVASLRPTGGIDDSTLKAAHIMLVVSNRSNETWTLDAADQRLELPSIMHGPAIVEATTITIKRPGTVDVPPQSTRWVDLYFPLPLRHQEAGELPAFNVIWSVRTGDGAVTRRTGFARFRADGVPLQERDLKTPAAPFEGESTLPGAPVPPLRPGEAPTR